MQNLILNKDAYENPSEKYHTPNETQLFKWILVCPSSPHFLFCQIFLGSFLTTNNAHEKQRDKSYSLPSYSLPKNRGVLPNSSKLAGWPDDVLCKRHFKGRSCSWKSCAWVYAFMKESCAAAQRVECYFLQVLYDSQAQLSLFFFFLEYCQLYLRAALKRPLPYSIGLITYKCSLQFPSSSKLHSQTLQSREALSISPFTSIPHTPPLESVHWIMVKCFHQSYKANPDL